MLSLAGTDTVHRVLVKSILSNNVVLKLIFQVGSHYHFIEVNKQLQFDRAVAYGMRLVMLP